MFPFHVPCADRQPRKHLLPALMRLQHELAKVSGNSGQMRHRPDPALREKPGEAGPETRGEDLAVVTPHAATQLQRNGARLARAAAPGAPDLRAGAAARAQSAERAAVARGVSVSARSRSTTLAAATPGEPVLV
ncbi:hypothetical protein ACWC98_38840 [Streptomyces goshikiensis]